MTNGCSPSSFFFSSNILLFLKIQTYGKWRRNARPRIRWQRPGPCVWRNATQHYPRICYGRSWTPHQSLQCAKIDTSLNIEGRTNQAYPYIRVNSSIDESSNLHSKIVRYFFPSARTFYWKISVSENYATPFEITVESFVAKQNSWLKLCHILTNCSGEFIALYLQYARS